MNQRFLKADPPGPDSGRIAIVVGRFNRPVAEGLYEGALAVLKRHDITDDQLTVAHVPGAFEIPLAVQALLEQKRHAAVIALGAVIRGETSHFDYICETCAGGLARLALDHGVPVSFGVLTAHSVEQALARSRADEHNKGGEAARAALEMIGLLKRLRA